ncbi:glycerophosphoryl diester phosphodiesterase [Natronospira proteinivora]|uniref:Glycerophosphoryl diester phosphodiesterase n=1 Tax=Natronospira proteinivora TaxID=1807133 RepID=A0ABT1G978_9GAMM|nr:glycerophosphodiester phosphodiesterase [Natronospira proteinivora]MCP1727874.1 glycerophosphoryl diester phosphodiesterase [Natronospira proteinivora]
MHRPNLIEGLWQLPGGIDGVEVDVRLSRDGVPVLHHDRCLPADGPAIEQLDYSALRGQVLDNGCRIPRLVDYLAACRAHGVKRLFLDIKVKDPEVLPIIHDVVQASALRREQAQGQVFWMVRFPEQVERVRSLMPDAPVVLLRTNWDNLDERLTLVKEGLVDYLVPMPRDRFLVENQALLREIREADAAMGVSIINQQENLLMAEEVGCSFAITDEAKGARC